MLLAATDVGIPTLIPGISLQQELVLLVEAGLTPLEALRTATLNPARVLGLADSLGTIEAGNLADLVLLDADPLADIANTQRIRAVAADGRLYRRAHLDRFLATVEALNRQVGQHDPRISCPWQGERTCSKTGPSGDEKGHEVVRHVGQRHRDQRTIACEEDQKEEDPQSGRGEDGPDPAIPVRKPERQRAQQDR